MALSQAFKDLLSAFAAAEVRYLVVGEYAVVHHGRPRFTKDLDLWLDPSGENLERATGALRDFGAPAHTLEHLQAARPEDVVWMGNPPVRIDLPKGIPGRLSFDEAWSPPSARRLGRHPRLGDRPR